MDGTGKTERKNSDGSSDHSSNKALTADTTKGMKLNEVVDLQKKMKILKDALLKERQEKETSTKSKKDMEKEFDRMKTQSQEKENQILKLRDEVADLQTKLQIEKKRVDAQSQGQKAPGAQEANISDMLSSSITGLTGGLTGMFGYKKSLLISLQLNKHILEKEKLSAEGGGAAGGGEDAKIKNELNYSKKQLEVMKEKLLKSEAAVEQLKKDARQNVEGSQKRLQEVEKDLETRVQAYRELHAKFEELDRESAGLKQSKERLDQEISRLREENKVLGTERDELEREYSEKDKVIEQLNEICQKMEGELRDQKVKVADARNQLEESELKLQIFDLKKSGKMMDTPAQILMRKNVNSEYLIEVEAAGERLTLYPQAVLSFGPIKETEDKFYFEFKNHRGEVERDTFQGEDRKKVLRCLKNFVKLADSNQANANNKDKGATKEKNILSQVVSFFGN